MQDLSVIHNQRGIILWQGASVHPCLVIQSGGIRTAQWDRLNPSQQACDIHPFPGHTACHGNWGTHRTPSSHSGPYRSAPLSSGSAPEWMGSPRWPQMTDLQSLPCQRLSPCTVSQLAGMEIEGVKRIEVIGFGEGKERYKWEGQKVMRYFTTYSGIFYFMVDKIQTLCETRMICSYFGGGSRVTVSYINKADKLCTDQCYVFVIAMF